MDWRRRRGSARGKGAAARLSLPGALLAVFALASGLIVSPSSPQARATVSTSRPPAQGASRLPSNAPNILLLVSDDQAWNTFSSQLMPNVWSHLVNRGVLFNRFYVNQSECCPSRSEIMTGLYAQHTGVDGNDIKLNRPTMIQALHDMGYLTMLSGKYLNSEACDVPKPEFDQWVCEGGIGTQPHGYTDPTLNINGTWTQFNGYTTDILANLVGGFIQSAPAGQPWFAMYTPTSPHLPANDPRCKAQVPPLREPSYYENTQSDGKPLYVQRPPYSAAEAALIDRNHQSMTDAVQCLDGSVGMVLNALDSNPSVEQNTIVFYLSDNGFLYGEHHRDGKVVPYEESVKVPFIVRAPMLHPESQPATSSALSENVDIAATISEMLGFHWGADGVSLVPVITTPTASIRNSVLIEYCEAASYPCSGGESPDQSPAGGGSVGSSPLVPAKRSRVPPYYGIVTSQYSYVEYQTKEKELYDLSADPYELVNLAGNAGYAQVQADLAAQLAALEARPPVDTTIVTGPSVAIAGRVASFTYFSQDRHATYDCRLTQDGTVVRDWFDCNGQAVTLGGLTDGSFVFEVVGTDSGAATDATPDSRSFSVSSTGPDVEITAHPSDHQQANTLSFTFGSQTTGVTFECSLEPLETAAVFAPCDPAQAVTYGPLADGAWDFQVAATDPSTGQTTAPPAEWLTNVDNAGPQMILLANTDLSAPTKLTQISLDFYPNEATSGAFTCRFDALSPFDCSLGHFSASKLLDGTHMLAVTAADTIGNVGTTDFSFTVDTTPPTVTYTSTPANPTNQTTASLSFTANETATFRCSLDSGAFGGCTSPFGASNLSEGSHTLSVKATDTAGNQSRGKVANWTVDLTPPTATISSGPPPLTKFVRATFRWSSDPGATFTCSLDGVAPTACASPITYNPLADGTHTFAVTPKDAAGNVGAPATYTWTVDTVSPTVTIRSKPSNPTNQTSASFAFDSNDPTATFTCSLDGAVASPCSSPTTYTGLAGGSHSFEVTAADAAGNSRKSSYAWVVDIQGPTTTISSAPPDPSSSGTATFAFSADESATFQCSLDGAPGSTCASPVTYPGLSDGSHVFSVTGTDALGNVGGPASYTWSIDTVAPVVSLTAAPANPTSDTSATFEFTVDDPNATLTCALDGVAPTPCTSPAPYSGLADGSHTFLVTATDSTGSGYASWTWTVDTVPPSVSITSGPSDPTNQTSATFDFTVSDASATTTTCVLDGGAPSPCTSPAVYTGLGNGTHSFTVTATDAAGNSASAGPWTWSVDTTAPSVSFVSGAANPTNQTTAVFGFTGSEEGATFLCSADAGPASACTSPYTVTVTKGGPHALSVTATDLAGNIGPASAYPWTIDLTAPKATILSEPPNPTTSTIATFEFTSNDPSATAACTLDGVLAACSSPMTYEGLRSGSHRFTVRLTDPAGNVGSASWKWTITAVLQPRGPTTR